MRFYGGLYAGIKDTNKGGVAMFVVVACSLFGVYTRFVCPLHVHGMC